MDGARVPKVIFIYFLLGVLEICYLVSIVLGTFFYYYFQFNHFE